VKTVRALLAVLVLGIGVPAAFGHPMGNFSVNRYARLEPSDRGVALLYLVDFAEIPSFQEVSRFPGLAADLAPASLNRASGRIALASGLGADWLAGLSLATDAGPLRFRSTAASIRFSPGAGGLPTMKLTIQGFASWPEGFRSETLRYADQNAPDRLGWREVVVRQGPGVALSGDFATADRSRELTDYPADPTADIPQVVKVTLRVAFQEPRSARRRGPAGGHPAEILGTGRERSLPSPTIGRPAGSAGSLAAVTPSAPSLGAWGPVARERSRTSGPGPTPSAQAGLREPEGKRTAAEGREDLPSGALGLAATSASEFQWKSCEGIRSTSRKLQNLSALTESVPSCFWSVPSTTSPGDPTISARWRRNKSGRTIAWAIPVSSSSVRKTKPFAVPGRWRTMTAPAARTRAPSGSSRSRAAVSTDLAARRGRTCSIRWGPVVISVEP
jgi:hypothetical protein